MATNGRLSAGAVNIGGNGGNYYFIDWQLAGQNISNNNSTINWQAYFHYNNADAQLDNGIANLSGTRWNNGGRVRNYGGQFTTRDVAIASGSFVIGHNADGTQGISVSGGVNVYGSGRSEGATSFSLPTIPRNSQVTTNAVAGYVLGTPLTVYTNRKAGFTHLIRIRQANSGGTIIQEVNNINDSYTWTPSPTQITDMEAMIPASNQLVLYIEQYNNQVGQWSNVSVTSNLTDANPTYSDFTFKDSNTSVTTITGNDQVLVKGQSTLEVTISSANKMVAIKSATADKYAITYDGTTLEDAYVPSGDVVDTFTDVLTVGSRAIQVGAYDSRGNNTTVAKNVVVYDYTAPVIEVDISREGNFGANVTIKTNGTFDLLPIGGSDKNALTTSTLEYRYREVGAGSWGSWVTIGFTTSTNTFTGTDKFVTLDNTKQFEFEVHITDKFGTVTQTGTIGTGKPILFQGSDSGVAAVGIGKLPEDGMLDVDGDIYSNGGIIAPSGVVQDFAGTTAPTGWLQCDGSAISRTTYAKLFAAIGTTWGAGNGTTTFNIPDLKRKTTVGAGGTGTGTLGNSVGNSGGSETHTLTIAEMPSHNHQVSYGNAPGTVGTGLTYSEIDGVGNGGPFIQPMGDNGAHNNIQPSAVMMKIIKT